MDDDEIQVTIHGKYGQGPMPVEFRDALAEMARLVKEAVDRGEIGGRRPATTGAASGPPEAAATAEG
jgi:hypothetical protein